MSGFVVEKIDNDESDSKIQNDRVGRGKFIFALALRRHADEILHRNTTGRQGGGIDPRTLVLGLCRPAGQVTDDTSMGQPVFILCLACVSSPVWTICVRQASARERGRHELIRRLGFSLLIISIIFPLGRALDDSHSPPAYILS